MRGVGLVMLPVVLAAIAAGCTTKKDEPPLATREQLLDPKTCTKCHADHYREWSGSMHAYASDDPVFRAMNKRGQRETGGALGKFCVNCHAPMAVRDGKTTDGLNLDALDPKYKGITCYFCHSIDNVDGAHNASVRLSDDLVMRGEYANPVANDTHRAGYSVLHDRDQADSAKLCGACHDITNDHGANIERTFAEWQASVFSKLGGGDTCSQCHMNQSPALRPIADAPNVFSREYHSHAFAGIDTALTPFPEADAQKQAVDDLLKTTLQGSVCVEASGNNSAIAVVLDAAGDGHAFPSGSAQDRRVWVEVVASNAGQVVFQSGVVPDKTSVTALQDPNLWLLRDCMFDDQSKEVRMFWQASSFEGNALPAQVTFDPTDKAFFQSHIVQYYPRDPKNNLIRSAIDHVQVRVRLLPMGYDVIDDLVASGDLDGAVRDKLQIHDVFSMEWTADAVAPSNPNKFTDADTALTAYCASNPAGFSGAADKVPAVNHTKCAP